MDSFNFDNVYQGSSAITAIYQGSTLIWPLSHPDINLNYIANGPDDTSGARRNVYFNTGFVPTNLTYVEMKCSTLAPNAGGNCSFLGATNVSSSAHFQFLLPRNATYKAAFVRHNGVFSQTTSTVYSANEKATVWEFYKTGNIMYLLADGTQLATGSSTRTDVTSYPLFILGKNLAGSLDSSTSPYGGSKIYYVKIFNNHTDKTLLHHFKPVRHWKDGEYVPCFYDEITDTYIYNKGTDTITYG